MTLNQTECSVCGAAVEGKARHCTTCGARSAPPIRKSLRALGWIPVVSLLALLLVLLIGGNDNPTLDSPQPDAPSVSSEASAPTTTVVDNLQVGPIRASSVTCSSDLPDYPCAALIDGDSTTAWNAPGGGEGAQITVLFDSTVRVTTVTFRNLADEEALMRNGRVQGVEVHVTGSAAIAAAELESGHGPYRVNLAPDPTDSLVIHIISTYPGEHFNDHEPFEELALQELTFLGITPTR